MIDFYLENIYLSAFSFFIVASTFSFLLVYPVKLFGNYFGFIDSIDFRKEYRDKIVRIGGLSIVVGSFISFIYTNALIKIQLDNQLLYVLIFSIFFFLIGFIDDILTIKPVPRLILQFFCSFSVWLFCNDLHFNLLEKIFFNNFPGEIIIIMGLLITAVWISGVTNAINWTDGLDGLASGVSIIILINLFFIFLTLNEIQLANYSIVLAGSCYGFFLQNYKPAKIIMGDGGSYFLGFNLASLCLIASNKFFIQYPSERFLSLLPLFLLIIPIVDMSLVIFTRIRNLKSPFYPDRNHLHHKLLKKGFSYKKTLIFIILLNLIASSIVLFLLSGFKYLIILICILFALNFIIKFKPTNVFTK